MIRTPFDRVLFPRALGLVLLFLLPAFPSPGATKKTKGPAASQPAPAALSTGPHYFFNLNLDSKYQLAGLGELTGEAAAISDCYCFTYYPNGKLERIEYRRAGAPVPDPYLQTIRIDFEYEPGLERRWYRDADGQPMNNLVGIQGEELKLNPSGFPTDVINLSSSGGHIRDSAGIIHYVRTLDGQSRVVALRRLGLLGTAIRDESGLFETQSTYDDQGHRNAYANADADARPLNDEDGVALTRTTYTFFPSSTQTIESYYDAGGLAVENKTSGVHAVQRTTDQRGFLLSESYFDVTGAPTLDNVNEIHERRYAYDDRGNQISEEFFDVDGKPRNQKSAGYSRLVYQYDDKNRVSEKAFFGDDGSPQVLLDLGAAVIRQEYDDQGHIVHRQFFDGQHHPSPHVLYGVPAIRIAVNGDTTMVTLRDAHDELTRNPVAGYASFSYLTTRDRPLSRTNKFFDLRGRPMSTFRVFVINPHLAALKSSPVMRLSAHVGAGAAGMGALLALALALRKSFYTRSRRVYVPTPFERFLGWFSIFAVIEGSVRFLITIWWAYVGYQNGQMGWGVYAIETVVVLFFLYRLPRMLVTMRVLNIQRDDIHGLVRGFFAKSDHSLEWFEASQTYVTDPLSVRIAYYRQKCHAYLAFRRRHQEGREMAARLNTYLRSQAPTIQAPQLTRALAFYYPCVALAYLGLAFLAFYTYWQMVKH